MSPSGLRVGVVGAGYWGPNLIRNCADLGILDSVCDADAGARATVEAAHPGIATLSSYDEQLTRPIDAVIIATPAQHHARMALQALAARKHVFVEKPLALTVPEAQSVVDAAQRAGLTVFVGHLLLYHPAVRRLRQAVAQGMVGHVWHIRSRRLSLGKLRAHESVWWSFAPHDVAVILAIMGSEPERATALQAACRADKIWDAAYADYVFANGATAHIEVGWLDPHKSARMDVFGSAGVLTLEDSRAGSSLVFTPCGARGGESGLAVWRDEPVQLDVEPLEPLKAELEAFVASVVSGQAAETDGNEGIAVLRMLKMADEAALQSDARAAVAV